MTSFWKGTYFSLTIFPSSRSLRAVSSRLRGSWAAALLMQNTFLAWISTCKHKSCKTWRRNCRKTHKKDHESIASPFASENCSAILSDALPCAMCFRSASQEQKQCLRHPRWTPCWSCSRISPFPNSSRLLRPTAHTAQCSRLPHNQERHLACSSHGVNPSSHQNSVPLHRRIQRPHCQPFPPWNLLALQTLLTSP